MANLQTGGERRPYVFFFNDTATTEIYTLSLHDALPIFCSTLIRFFEKSWRICTTDRFEPRFEACARNVLEDRKSTRLNSSHGYISYAVFCLKKKKRPHAHSDPRPPPNLCRRPLPAPHPP